MASMNRQNKRWEIEEKLKTSDTILSLERIIKILLKNRGLKTAEQQKDFFNPKSPLKLTLSELKIKDTEVKKAITRLLKAKKNKEKIFIYGDYDADGICGTAVLWENLYKLGFDVLPYIPERFSEGYGINFESIKILKDKYPNLKLIITVDNGIVAVKEVKAIKELGVDVIISDHHEPEKIKPVSLATIHSTLISGSAMAWVFAREVVKKFKGNLNKVESDLDLVAIGTIADQVPLISLNRSFAKYGLEKLNQTERPGLLAIFNETALKIGNIGTYEVGFMIAPRINAMGRLANAIDSLRLLCVRNPFKARDLAKQLSKTNLERQKIVDEVVLHARSIVTKDFTQKVIILAHESYHEGVIGLAAGKLTEEFHRPSIVISKGKDMAKASARSIPGFNIIENLRKLDKYLQAGGGHPMAAGFSIAVSDIDIFIQKFQKLSDPLLTEEILERKLKADMEIGFNNLDMKLEEKLEEFSPFGLGNSSPVFVTRNAEVIEAKTVGREMKHLKFVLRNKDRVFGAIGFNLGYLLPELIKGRKIDIAYNLEKNVWNNSVELQLKIKDLKVLD